MEHERDLTPAEFEAALERLMVRVGDSPEEVRLGIEVREKWCAVMRRGGSLREQLAVFEAAYGDREPETARAQMSMV